MVIISAFQAEDAGSIPVTCSKDIPLNFFTIQIYETEKIQRKKRKSFQREPRVGNAGKNAGRYQTDRGRTNGIP